MKGYLSRVIDGKENEIYARSNFQDSPGDRGARGKCEADSDCTHAETSILVEFTIKPARKLVVKPPATVDLRFCPAAFHDDSLLLR